MFKSMLESGMMEGETGEVSITDMNPDVFSALLHFIYSDDLPEELQVWPSHAHCMPAFVFLSGAQNLEVVRDTVATFDAHCCPRYLPCLWCIFGGSRDTEECEEEYRLLQEGRMTTAMAQHLLLAADRYQLIRLRTMCEKRLCDSVDVETVATTLMLADKSNADNLRKVRLACVSCCQQ